METQQYNRSLGELFGDLTREMSTLVRQEVNLAKTEMTQKATDAGKRVGMLAAGGAIAYGGFLALLWTIAYGLTALFALPIWLSYLIVAVIAGGVGAFLVMRGIDELKKTNLTPQQTVDTIKEDVTWMKQQTS